MWEIQIQALICSSMGGAALSFNQQQNLWGSTLDSPCDPWLVLGSIAKSCKITTINYYMDSMVMRICSLSPIEHWWLQVLFLGQFCDVAKVAINHRKNLAKFIYKQDIIFKI